MTCRRIPGDVVFINPFCSSPPSMQRTPWIRPTCSKWSPSRRSAAFPWAPRVSNLLFSSTLFLYHFVLTNIAAVPLTLAADAKMDTLSILALLADAPASAAAAATPAAAAAHPSAEEATAAPAQPGLTGATLDEESAETDAGSITTTAQVCVVGLG